MRSIEIKTPRGIRKIGAGAPTFIVAELSGNHNGSLARAKRIIDAAAKAGADAVKLQTYTADTLTIDSDRKYFRLPKGSNWAGQTLYELYKNAYTPWHWQPALKRHAEKKGLVFFSTPFDETAVTFLEKLRAPLYKIAGYEMSDFPLLRRIAKSGKPVIISAAMATPQDIALSVRTLRRGGAKDIIVLHCVNAYPASPHDMNVRTIPDIMRRFRVLSGLSDHSLGESAALASVALGGSVIEKHLTLSRKDGGPDAKFSLEPEEFRHLVGRVRELEQTLGRASYKATAGEKPNRLFKRSLFVVRDMKQGERFSTENLRIIRPGHGLSPVYFERLLGTQARKDIKRGTPVSRKLISIRV